MSENTNTMNLNKKLFELRKYVDVVKKSKNGYTYASIVEILAKLKAGMDKYGLLLEEECVHGSQKIVIDHYEKPKVLKDGKTIQEVVHEFVVSQDIIFTWIDAFGDHVISPPFTPAPRILSLPGSMLTAESLDRFLGLAVESRPILPRHRVGDSLMRSVNS